jgi:DNA-binding NarL/FixJ family response regulator
MSEPPLRVIVADDQTVVREGLVTLLGLADGIEVVGSAADGEGACALVRDHAPDVALLDLQMPGVGGVEATRRIRHEHPGTEVVILTTYTDDASILEALEAGARGYLTKDAGRSQIALALRAAASGQAALDPGVQERLLVRARRGVEVPGAPEPPPDGLTSRELEVVALIGAGLTNAQIALRLHITEATVKSHVNHLFAKAGLRDRAQAVRYAYAHGLVEAG